MKRLKLKPKMAEYVLPGSLLPRFALTSVELKLTPGLKNKHIPRPRIEGVPQLLISNCASGPL